MLLLGCPHRVLDLVASSWSLVLELCEHHKALWSAVRAYLSFAMHPSLLVCSQDQVEEVQPVLKQVHVYVRACVRVCMRRCMHSCTHARMCAVQKLSE